MARDAQSHRHEERTAAGRFLTGANIGIAAGIVGIVLPVALVLLATYEPGALLPLTSVAVRVTTLLALVGAVLFAISLIFYRRAFAGLRALDHRFWAASILCLVGTVGFLLLLLAAAVALSSSDSITQCLHGAPTRMPSCLLTSAPSAAYSGSVGLVLIWLGGVGVVVGLGLAGRRLGKGAFYGGAIAYAVLLVVLAGPLLAVLYPVGVLTEIVLVAPLLVLVAPALVADGSRSALGR